MPKVDFESLPDSARVWIFGAESPVVGQASDDLLAAVDRHLSSWKAHGAPLVCARDWVGNRFLAVAVDEAATGASGCSIDGMFRVLADVEEAVGTSLVGGGRIFWRDEGGAIRTSSRNEFVSAAREGEVTESTKVFDTTVNTVGGWRGSFERPVGETWHSKLLPSTATKE